MRINALFTYDYGIDSMQKLRDLGYNIIIKSEKNLQYTDEFEDVEVLVTYNPFSTLDISKMKRLKWIQLLSIGFDQLPKQKIEEQKIIVTNNKNGYVIPIAEWILLKILELYKNSSKFYENKKNKIWKLDTTLLELYKKTVGIVGTGGIAIETAKRLKAFDVTVLGVNKDGRAVTYFDRCYSTDAVYAMFNQCDVVISLIPSTDETYHFFNEKSFTAMKDGVVFINASRGEVVDEQKLIEFLRNKKIRGAALDVFEHEPLENTSPLWELENVIISPHNAWVSESRDVRIYHTIYENMQKYKQKESLINVVDIHKGY